MGEAAATGEQRWSAPYSAPVVALFDSEPANDTKPSTAADVPRYRWIHACNEGKYEGHHQGAFDMTRDVFETFQRNFRGSPQFRSGTLELDGKRMSVGTEPVIQFDFEHASEVPPWEGSIPEKGSPAPAWAIDVAIRNGADGKAQLWVLADLGLELHETSIRHYIATRKYRWVSIAFALESRDWKTNEPRGPLLTSVAFTNHPFMQDLTALWSRRASQPSKDGVGSSRSPSEAPGANADSSRPGASMEKPLRERVCRALKIRVAADDAEVGEAVEHAAGAAGNLKGLLEQLGVTNADDAMKAIPQLRAAEQQLVKWLGEIRALLQQDQAVDGEIAAADVAGAMRAAKMSGDGAKDALTAYRNHLIAAEEQALIAKRPEAERDEELRPSEARAARKAGREKFLARYGVKPEHAHLTTTLVADKGGKQVVAPTEPVVLPIGDRSDGDKPVRIDLTGIKAPNVTLRLIEHLKKSEPGFDKLGHQQQIARASAVRKTAELVLE